jgi:hypothetical protein
MLFERVQQSQRPEPAALATSVLPAVQGQTSGDAISQQNEKTVRLGESSLFICRDNSLCCGVIPSAGSFS